MSIGLLGNAAKIFPKFVEKNIIPEIVTDQTSAHDELQGYIPHTITFEEAISLRETDPDKYINSSYYKALFNMYLPKNCFPTFFKPICSSRFFYFYYFCLSLIKFLDIFKCLA